MALQYEGDDTNLGSSSLAAGEGGFKTEAIGQKGLFTFLYYVKKGEVRFVCVCVCVCIKWELLPKN